MKRRQSRSRKTTSRRNTMPARARKNKGPQKFLTGGRVF